MKNLNNKLLVKHIFFVALSTLILMTTFEIVKQLIHSKITIWESHFSTIVFTTCISIIATYFALTNYYSSLKLLSGFIPICAYCKKIRDTKGNWISFEIFILNNSSAELTHGICSECSKIELEKFEKL